ncbi:zinc finger BED domain-containing protein DAYSLEEPER-like [Lycium barbarum]|uniref:zinc finger BED domain-containing protein DAYSLEEPER-like n=1 Tax=Lycium barbarum TaxID=112863 RepID=UPI00293EEA5F|nr:zinc finger BED domain-containing protein DAYSLEEPER-like [Lycium barbarum]
MESQNEENSVSSSSSTLPVPIEGESQRSSQIIEFTESEKRKLKSKSWRHFKPASVNGVRYGICNYCNARIKANRKCGTSSMSEHFRRCPNKPRNLGNDSGSGGDDSSQHYFDQDVSRKELAHAIILHEYPPSIVDHVGFRKFVASLQPLFKMVSRNTIKNDILRIFDNLK